MPVQSLSMPIGGMTCDNCARGVERTLSATPGVTKVTVDLEGGSASVEYDTDLVTPQALATAVRKLGYEASA